MMLKKWTFLLYLIKRYKPRPPFAGLVMNGIISVSLILLGLGFTTCETYTNMLFSPLCEIMLEHGNLDPLQVSI